MIETLPLRPSLDRDRPVVALGVALLATAVVLSAFYSRESGDLDLSNFAVGLLATGGLLLFAVGTYLRLQQGDRSSDLVAWPGAFGSVGVGLMVAVAMDTHDATPYVAGLLVVLLSAAGLALTRRGPFVVTGVLGLLVAYLQGIDDAVGTGDGEGVPGVQIALALALFALLVTAAGWRLPASRVLSGAVAGGVTVVGFAVLTGVLSFEHSLSVAFSGMSSEDGVIYGSSFDGPVADSESYTADAWTILLLALALVLGWCLCAAVTGHVAYRLLVVAMTVTIIPLAMQLLTVTHPSWWGLALGVAGGGVLVLAGLRALRPAPRPEPGPKP
ncbi:hypothetical protein [Nocardioides lianchengensis]|uniref:Uncharacterized protein n=1 Tax=Nocardioides lianchengensis TaxID=1045774 RepID=A0A1G6M0U3_9ACTN|nr:hypothetical protein [Nocardioides lianchengensis]NYG12387.1 hypothetical protein [Nocardioides lianchengensis]SDC49090.1 hypothetical protein SAMN05421872_102417 [Nocardioides lianchengensis]